MALSPKLARIGSLCVACGCCADLCPRGAVSIPGGVAARVDEEKCVGCGRCEKACPAAVITMVRREAAR